MSFSPGALALFQSRAIDPDLAVLAEVTETAGTLHFPNDRYRPLDGHTISKAGIPTRPLWVPRKPSTADAVLLCEGETDALAAASALKVSPEPPGYRTLPVLAVPGCAFSPAVIASGLRRYGVKEAFVAYDADQPGREAAARLSGTLRSTGITPIPAEPPAEDFAAWLASMNGSRGEAIADHLANAEAAYAKQRRGVSFADVMAAEVEWLWRERIPLRTLTALAGDPKRGKSLFTIGLAAELSRAGKTVLMANAEDGVRLVRHRLAAARADVSRVFPVDGFSLPSGVGALRERVEATGASLVTIDPYAAFLDDHVNAVRDQAIRGALSPLLRLAEDYDCAVVVICHLNRGGDEENPIYRIPVGLRGIARSLLMMNADGLAHLNTNYGPTQPLIKYRYADGALTEEAGLSSKTKPIPEATVWDFTKEYDD